METGVNDAPTQVLPPGRVDLSERQAAGLLLFTAALCVVVLFWPTIRSMIDVWESSRTFAHGFLVLPATGYLVWSYRQKLGSLTPVSSAWGLVALLLSGSGWVAGNVAHLPWLQQAAVVSSFPGMVLTVYGTDITRTLSWPLGFLFFMVPVGTALTPWLQDITAWLILVGLDLSGITSVYGDYHITVGSAVWEVAPDCGGLRYLLPGLSLAYAFAALTYRQPSRRILFLIVCAVVLMVANGIRAYGVIVGNYVGIAEGTDHRVFSYTIYGLTMPLLLWGGLKWKQGDALASLQTTGRAHPGDRPKAILVSLGGVSVLALARIVVWLLPATS